MHGVYDGEHDTVTIKVAAERLCISEQAVRQRIRRKTLPAQRLDGKLYVVLSAEHSAPITETNGVHADVASAVQAAYTELVDQLRRENDLLRTQLGVKDDQLRANQVIMSQLAERMRALPAPRLDEPPMPEGMSMDTEITSRPKPPWWQFWKVS